MDTDTAHNSEYVRQFSVFLPNRPGALLGIVKLLGDSHIDVLGLSVQDSIDVTVVRIIVTDPDTVETLFIEKGVPFGSCDVLVVQLKESARDLTNCLMAFRAGETNIHFAYPLLVHPDGRSGLVLHVEDIEIGTVLMSNHGFRVLRQGDLSR